MPERVDQSRCRTAQRSGNTGENNEFMNWEFFSRSALDVAPTPADQMDLDGDNLPDTIQITIAPRFDGEDGGFISSFTTADGQVIGFQGF